MIELISPCAHSDRYFLLRSAQARATWAPRRSPNGNRNHPDFRQDHYRVMVTEIPTGRVEAIQNAQRNVRAWLNGLPITDRLFIDIVAEFVTRARTAMTESR
jgi:hypothetical protein